MSDEELVVPMRRAFAWNRYLLEWAVACVGEEVEWGRTDCAALARTSLEKMFGEDVVPWLPPWASALQAAKVLRDHGGSIDAILRQLHPEEVTTTAFSRAGDLVIMQREEREGLVGKESVFVNLDGKAFLTADHDTGLVALSPRPKEGLSYSIWEIPRG